MKKESMKTTTKYTFWELLSDYKIEIPKIQRDYVQGRKDAKTEKIADKFLNDLKNSIKNNEKLSLDFVYGKVKKKTLIPIDGQQRLTTLFLIHWYIALKENKLTDEIKTTLSKFTYETRVSSEDFCKNLVSENIDYNLIEERISDIITDSKWYFLSWELDPTVAAMLNMLDTIHQKFKDIEESLFEKLKQESNITFQFLPLKPFKLTDELYIKMNARGKPLTEFENFKANFSHYLEEITDKSKLDNEWLDIFWNLEKKNWKLEKKKNLADVDKKFFNFFENITLNFYAEENDVKEELENYSLFDIYNQVYDYDNNKYVNQIISILNSLITYEDTERIFEDFLSSPSNWERLRFYSLCHFFIRYGQVNDSNKVILERWMRITQNLINNTLIQNKAHYQGAIGSISELSNNISNIYAHVSSSSDNIKYFSKSQREEESLKAKLILQDADWKNLLVKIEKHSYFDGQIGFILQYSKNEKGYDKSMFDDYSTKLSKLFGGEFCEKHDFLFQRALLIKGNYLIDIRQNKTFCQFQPALRTKLDNWRKVFNDKEKTLFLKELLDDIDKNDIQTGLKNIIKNHSVKDWRKLIIKHPDNISYCQHRQIRLYSDDKVYLLFGKQMNGYHKEIFSWDLFRREFDNKNFRPFSNKPKYQVSTSFDEPYITLESFKYKENRFEIHIIYEKEGRYTLEFYGFNNIKIPNDTKKLLKEAIDLEENTIISLPENEVKKKTEDIYCKFENLIKLAD